MKNFGNKIWYDLHGNTLRHASTKKEAWEKTFTKWHMIANYHGIVPNGLIIRRCGLCDIYSEGAFINCEIKGGCPIFKDTGDQYCDGVYSFRLLVRNIIYEQKTQSELILQQISYLCRIYKEDMEREGCQV